MLADWNVLSDATQLTLSREALRHAAETIASQAETLAQEIDLGTLSDRGGADALRLLAAVIRLNGQDMAGIRDMATAGHA